MAKWFIDQQEHQAPLKLALGPKGARLESAHPVNGGTFDMLTGQLVSMADGVAGLQLSQDELDELRRWLGGGRLTFDNQTGIELFPSVAIEHTDAGPHYRITLAREPSFHGFPGDDTPARGVAFTGAPGSSSASSSNRGFSPVQAFDSLRPGGRVESPDVGSKPALQSARVPKRPGKPGRKPGRKKKAPKPRSEPSEARSGGAPEA